MGDDGVVDEGCEGGGGREDGGCGGGCVMGYIWCGFRLETARLVIVRRRGGGNFYLFSIYPKELRFFLEDRTCVAAGA